MAEVASAAAMVQGSGVGPECGGAEGDLPGNDGAAGVSALDAFEAVRGKKSPGVAGAGGRSGSRWCPFFTLSAAIPKAVYTSTRPT